MFFFGNEKKKYLDILNEIALPIESKEYWWARYPKRACEEIYKLKENTNAFMETSGNRLIWKEEIINNFGSAFVISIETNSKYPFSMPKTFLLKPHIEPSDDKHMFKDGSLCLMHPSSYNSRISILQIRNQASAWCFCIEAYANTGKWPAAEYSH